METAEMSGAAPETAGFAAQAVESGLQTSVITMETLHNGLKLLQTDKFQKLGQDSVLLAHFASPRRFARVLDLGCGTGALALSIYRPDLKITGLDIQPGAVALFRQSIALNGVEIEAKVGDLRQIRSCFPHGSFDYAVCNPPYFAAGSGKEAAGAARAAARTEGEASIEETAAALSFVLHDGGKCALVFRPERLWALLNALQRLRLTPKRLRFVHDSVEKRPSAVLVECRKGSAEGLVVEPPFLCRRENGDFSEEYKAIYNL